MKALDFAASQDEATDSFSIARSAVKPVPKMDRTQLVFVSSLQSVIAHGDDGDLIGRTREEGADRHLRRNQRGRIEPFGPACGDNALRPGTGPLDDRLASKIDA